MVTISHHDFSCVMRLVIALLYLCGHVIPGNAQPGWFRIYDLGFNPELCSDIHSFGDYILFTTFCQGQDTINRNELICLNKDGDVKWRTFLKYPEETNVGQIAFRPKGSVIAKDSSIYVLTESLVQGERIECVVNKFSIGGNLIWMNQYGDTQLDIFPSRYGICLEVDSLNIAICGSLGYGSMNEDIVVYRIDSSGALVQRIVADPTETRISTRTPIVGLSDGSLLLAYNHRSGSDALLRDHLVHIQDSQQIEEYSVSDWPTAVSDLKLHPNGNIVYMTREPDIWAGGMRIRILTQSFDTVHTYLYSDHDLPYVFLGNSDNLNLSIASDGRFLASGYNISHAVILCFDSIGNLLWTRELALEGYSNIAFAYVSWASDGGILLNGSLIHNKDSCQFQACPDVFIFKLDSSGCLTPNCEETTIISGFKDLQSDSKGFAVFPNPTAGKFELTYTGIKLNDILNAKVNIYDSQGRSVYVTTVTDDSMNIDLTEFSPGLYFIQVQNRNEIFLVSIVKQ